MLTRLFKMIDNSCQSCMYYEYAEVEPARMEETDGRKDIIPARYMHMCRYQTFNEATRRRKNGEPEKNVRRAFTDRVYDVPLNSLTPCKEYKF